jgi:hypothetical protein
MALEMLFCSKKLIHVFVSALPSPFCSTPHSVTKMAAPLDMAVEALSRLLCLCLEE